MLPNGVGQVGWGGWVVGEIEIKAISVPIGIELQLIGTVLGTIVYTICDRNLGSNIFNTSFTKSVTETFALLYRLCCRDRHKPNRPRRLGPFGYATSYRVSSKTRSTFVFEFLGFLGVQKFHIGDFSTAHFVQIEEISHFYYLLIYRMRYCQNTTGRPFENLTFFIYCLMKQFSTYDLL